MRFCHLSSNFFLNVQFSDLPRVIQSLTQYSKRLLGRSSGDQNVNKVSSDSPPSRSYNDFRFTSFVFFVIVNYYKMETVIFNILCHLLFLFAIKERKEDRMKERKQIQSCVAFLNWHFGVLFSSTLCIVGTCQCMECTSQQTFKVSSFFGTHTSQQHQIKYLLETNCLYRFLMPATATSVQLIRFSWPWISVA
jgi:hypothetical protein